MLLGLYSHLANTQLCCGAKGAIEIHRKLDLKEQVLD
jgi:hypothetical protein